MQGKEDDSQYISTTKRSLEILETVHELGGAKSTTLVEVLDVARSTVHKHLHTLCEEGYLVKEDEVYHLSLKLMMLGSQAQYRKPEYAVARDTVSEIAAEVDAEVDFSVEEHGRIYTVYNEQVGLEDPDVKIGQQYYMHSTSAGKAALAEMSDERVREIVDRWGLPAETQQTITSVDGLFEELETVREQGYATNEEESIEGKHAISVTVSRPGDTLVGTLTISGPAYQLSTDALVERFPSYLNAKATELEDQIRTLLEGDSTT